MEQLQEVHLTRASALTVIARIGSLKPRDADLFAAYAEERFRDAVDKENVGAVLAWHYILVASIRRGQGLRSDAIWLIAEELRDLELGNKSVAIPVTLFEGLRGGLVLWRPPAPRKENTDV